MPVLDLPCPNESRTDYRTPISPELHDRLGGIPIGRIRLNPPPGTATMADALWDGKCELIDGTLVDKYADFRNSVLSGAVISSLMSYKRERQIGFVTGGNCGYEMKGGQLRQPTVAFVYWSKIPGGVIPEEHQPELVPDLAVDFWGKSNTEAEMRRKRAEYFASGVRLVWEIDRFDEIVTVYRSDTDFEVLKLGDVLDGSDVLPGFELAVSEIFGELE